MHIIMDPTVATFVGFIAEPTDVLTTDIRIRMEDIIPTPMEDIIVHPISGDGVISIATVGTKVTFSANGVLTSSGHWRPIGMDRTLCLRSLSASLV